MYLKNKCKKDFYLSIIFVYKMEIFIVGSNKTAIKLLKILKNYDKIFFNISYEKIKIITLDFEIIFSIYLYLETIKRKKITSFIVDKKNINEILEIFETCNSKINIKIYENQIGISYKNFIDSEFLYDIEIINNDSEDLFAYDVISFNTKIINNISNEDELKQFISKFVKTKINENSIKLIMFMKKILFYFDSCRFKLNSNLSSLAFINDDVEINFFLIDL